MSRFIMTKEHLLSTPLTNILTEIHELERENARLKAQVKELKRINSILDKNSDGYLLNLRLKEYNALGIDPNEIETASNPSKDDIDFAIARCEHNGVLTFGDLSSMTKEECRNTVFGRKWKPICDIEWLLHEAGLKFKT